MCEKLCLLKTDEVKKYAPLLRIDSSSYIGIGMDNGSMNSKKWNNSSYNKRHHFIKLKAAINPMT